MTNPAEQETGDDAPSGLKGFFRRLAEAKRWFAAALCVYAAIVIYLFATGSPSTTTVRVNIGIWTLLPPVLFVVEYWAMSPLEGDDFHVFVAEQQMAGRVWAAVLAVLVLTQTSLPLVGPGG